VQSKSRGRLVRPVLALALVLSVACGYAATSGAATSKSAAAKKTVYWVSPLIADGNWFRFNTCLTRAVTKLGYKAVQVGPPTGTNIPLNVQEMYQAINQKPAAIIVTALNNSAYGPPIAAARKAGIPVITTVSGGTGTKENAYIGVNWKAWGTEAAQLLGKATGGDPHVGIIAAGTSFADQLIGIAAFKKELKKLYPKSEVDSLQYDNAVASTALTETSAMLEAHPDINALWNATGGTDSVAMAEAVKTAGRTGKVKILAGDLLPQVVTAIKTGQVIGSELTIGCIGGTATAQLANKVIKGAKVPYVNYYPTPYVTKTNVAKYLATEPTLS
jgi:ribose transport system substrate-binding protein